MSRVVHFEIPTSDLKQAAAFYENVFAWKSEPWPGYDDYHLLSTGPEHRPGINGALNKREGGVINTIQVENLEGIKGRVVEFGGHILSDEQFIRGLGTLFYIQDPDGNVFGILGPTPEDT